MILSGLFYVSGKMIKRFDFLIKFNEWPNWQRVERLLILCMMLTGKRKE